MNRTDAVTNALLPGAASGLVGGLAFGGAMIELGLLQSIASLVGAQSAVLGFVVHMVIAAIIGAGFGLFVWYQRPAPGEIIYWGLVYGAAWWFIGAVTLLPALSGDPIAWEVESARGLLPALIGHLFYGLITAVALVAVSSGRQPLRIGAASMARGAVAGVIGAVFLGSFLMTNARLPIVSSSMTSDSMLLAWTITIIVGLAAGLGYAVLHPAAEGGLGPALIRGLAYGFVVWITAALTVIPLLAGDGLPWSVEDIRMGFATFPGYLLLLGAMLALTHHGLTRIGLALFSDDLSAKANEGVGTQGLRAAGRGVAAGLVGGLIFTIVMVQIGFLSTVAGLVGQESTVTGLLVHLVVASVIGIGYGLLFVRRSNDLGSALGWGVTYGFLWWLLGPLTLLPVFLGDGPQWEVAAAADAYPALIGHIAYGALLGVTFFRLESRHSPWWISRGDAEEARIARAREQLLGSAPGLWALTALIALTIPILLGT